MRIEGMYTSTSAARSFSAVVILDNGDFLTGFIGKYSGIDIAFGFLHKQNLLFKLGGRSQGLPEFKPRLPFNTVKCLAGDVLVWIFYRCPPFFGWMLIFPGKIGVAEQVKLAL